nr:glycosyltransferase family 4 protein [Neoroseomonas soli]
MSRTGPFPRAAPPAHPAPGGLRVLVFSHLHPAVSRGGAEIAAYQMYRALRAMPGVTAWFAAGAGARLQPPLGTHVFQPFGADEFVLGNAGYDSWLHSAQAPRFGEELRALVAELRPDVVHFHHYSGLGVEAMLQVKQAAPAARIVMTLHEYLAICHHFGQMVTRPNLDLCSRETPRDCARCFPERSENDFFLRKMYLQRFLRLVDHFIAPSRFLADRYIAWGLPAERFSVIENGQPEHGAPPVPMPPPKPLVVGFFGQLSMLKGVGLLLDAAEELRRRPPRGGRLRIEIWGDASNQPPELRAEVERRLQESRTVVGFNGPYENSEAIRLMQRCHAVLVPSIWWENSPMVIQEAFAARRPVICSDIGGMAEKVRDGVDGFHFRARSAAALAELLRGLAEEPERVLEVQERMAGVSGIGATLREVLAKYQGIALRTP